MNAFFFSAKTKFNVGYVATLLSTIDRPEKHQLALNKLKHAPNSTKPKTP
jgi:hypothetical protein